MVALQSPSAKDSSANDPAALAALSSSGAPPPPRARRTLPVASEKVRFATKSDFHTTLNQRIDAYFDAPGRTRHATPAMVLKSIFWFGGFVAVYALFLSNLLTFGQQMLCAAVLGFFLAAIGFNIGHDAIHGAYSANPWVNRVFGWTFQIMGAATYNWSVAHNIVHHTFTNMPGHDGDIEPGPLLRFHDVNPIRGMYRLQHLYGWVLYCFLTLNWVFVKDVQQMFMKNPRTGKRPPPIGIASIIMAKVLHVGLFVVLPFTLLELSFLQIAFVSFIAHAVAGFTLAVVFQLAHVVEGPDMPVADEKGHLDDSFAAHQLKTTANFSRGSAMAQFICGGLNHQVEHHLYPKICHIHYPAIAHIVEETAREFGLPYHEHRTFMGAVASHYRVLKRMGRERGRADSFVAAEALPTT